MDTPKGITAELIRADIVWGTEDDGEIFSVKVKGHTFNKGQGGYRFAEPVMVNGRSYSMTVQLIDGNKDPKLVAAASAAADAKALKANELATKMVLQTLAMAGQIKQE